MYCQLVLVGKDLLDYSLWDELKVFYFEAIHAGRCVRELLLYDATGGDMLPGYWARPTAFACAWLRLNCCSIFCTEAPVSIAVELATAR